MCENASGDAPNSSPVIGNSTQINLKQLPHSSRTYEARPIDSLEKMSTYGTLYRVTTYGESHCASVGAIIDGCPSVRALPSTVHPSQSDSPNSRG